MVRLAPSTCCSIRDSLATSCRGADRHRSETVEGDGAWRQLETGTSCADDDRALCSWLLAIDRVVGAGLVGIALQAGWLQISLQGADTVAGATEEVRRLRGAGLATAAVDTELIWGDIAPQEALLAAGRDGSGRCVLRYNTAHVCADAAGILASLWSTALRAPPHIAIADIPWDVAVSPSVRHAPPWRHRGGRDIVSVFMRVVRRQPTAIAVSELERNWTYAEVDARSGAIAEALQANGVKPGDIVAIGLPRGGEAIAAMLGVLRAGAAYLPVDLDDPIERLRHVVGACGARVLIGEARAHSICATLALTLIDVAQVEFAADGPLPELHGEALAYVMFTSGSTGMPKGVEVRHQGVTRLVVDCSFMQLDTETAMLHAAPLGFDASTLEIWGPLLNGGRCVVHGEVIPTGEGLAEAVRVRGARAAWLTSALFNAVVDDDARHLAGLETLLIGGEALSVSHVQKFLEAAPATRLINGYGPTETTTFASTHDIVREAIEGASSVPIGGPINATSLYVLNRRGEPVPRGLVGELHIGGLGVARGYLGQPQLSAERFLPDPFAVGDAVEAKMYRTGDEVRMRADGTLDFVGRLDGQVKIRGFRVETGEIEFALARCPEVRASAVICHNDPARGAELVAYVVPAAGDFSPSTLKQRLGATLPAYMIPAQWVRLDALPVTANGKLDRQRLPAPRRVRSQNLAQPFVEPAAGPERDVAQVLADVLGIDRVGALDNFFELGGNSLLVVRAHAGIRDAGHQGLSIARFFAEPTPRGLARHLVPAAAADRGVKPAAGGGELHEPIAVIGMAGRFPGARDVEELWRVLCEGRETITFFSRDELDASVPDALRSDPRYVAARGVIADADQFDAGFFGISAREAELMDPQQRVFLEIAWECLERAGQMPEKTPEPIGVFAGVNSATYYANHIQGHPEKIAKFGEFLVMVANEKDYVATRTAHKLGLTGPAVCVQTACSTSLVAVAQAFDALRAGRCGLALAGGSSISCPPRSGYLYQDGAMLSPDGHTRTFDADARGTVFSDGAAVVLLKRLSDAVRDGNTIYAVIRGVAVNNDGADRASFTAPNVAGQAAVVRSALKSADVDARSIDYVEAHGTATPLGDPIEVAALTDAYCEHTRDAGYCAIGSLKSNTGHLVIAAGAAGLIKTVLSLHNEKLPATLNYSAPNPKLELAESPFVVNAHLRDWPRGERVRRAAVSSFGVGGTNAHAILEEAPLPAPARAVEGATLLRLSAPTPSALARMQDRLAEHLENNPDLELADVGHTLDVGRRDFAHRAAIVAETAAEAASLLRKGAGSRQPRDEARLEAERRPVLMFPGQGAQYGGMGQQLYRHFPECRRVLDDCFDAVSSHVRFDLRERMFCGDPAALLPTAVAQPATFAIEYALARLWLARGVVPAALIGHSVGEFVCATLAGVMRFEDAIGLVAHRGALMQALPPGAMLSVRASAADLAPLLSASIQLAAENGPVACVVAGPESDIEALAARLGERGVATKRLPTSHAFHSAMMEPAVPLFEEAVRGVALSAPELPIASSVTGAWLSQAEAADPGYWARHMRQPVRFAAAVRCIVEGVAAPLFFETGPGSALCGLVRQQRVAGNMPLAVASLGGEPAREVRLLTEAAGMLWRAGCAVSWPAVRPEERRRIVLPTYPFERQRYWLDSVRKDPQAAVVRMAPRSQPVPPQLSVLAQAATQADHNAPAQSVPPAPIALPVAAAATPGSQWSLSSVSNRRAELVRRLRGLFEDVSGLELGDADARLSFVELGLDSLTMTQIALQLKNEFAVPVTFRQLMESLRNFDDLAGHLDAQLPAEADAPTEAPQAAVASFAPVQFGTASRYSSQYSGASVVPSDAPLVQQVIQQQLALMAQQLVLLQGHPVSVAETYAQAPTGSPIASPPQQASLGAPTAASAADGAGASAVGGAAGEPGKTGEADQSPDHAKYDVKKAFGAIARIHSGGCELTERQRTRLDALIRRYVESTQKSKAYTAEHRAHLADPRVVNGFRPQLKEIIYQIVIERSKGARVWDIDGNEYVDALSGFGMSLFGWQPEFVVEAVRRQLDSGYEIGPQHPLAGPVAKLICELTGFDRAGLCNTGSEAVMGCVRIARTVTGRTKIAIFSGAYHGIFDEVIVRGTRKGRAVPAAPGIMKNTAENVVVLEYGVPETLLWLKENAHELAAVLVEPVQSRRPDLQPREFLGQLRALTEAQGALLIFDEVVTGFRSHPGGAQAIFDIRADLAAYGKVVGGGFPIGVIAGKRDYMDALDGGHWVFGDDSIPTVGVTYFAGTFVRHPLALAAAHAVLKHLKAEGPKLQEALTSNTSAMVAELNAFCREAGAPITVKHFASVWKIFFDEEHPLQDLLFAMMRNRGVHILDNFPCFMTTAHDAAAIEVIKAAFKAAVSELQQSDFLPRRYSATVLAFDASKPPRPDARLGRDADGKPAWFIANPDVPGKYIKVEAQ